MSMPAYVAKYTYQDYLGWPDDERWEIINGEAYAMTPSPTATHQDIVVSLTIIIGAALREHSSRLFVAPFDVVLSETDVVQPDLLVVCDPAKITEKCIQGAPDLIIEILSPSTALRDIRDKKTLYEKSGVREYIIIHPADQYVERFSLDENGAYGASEVFGRRQELILGVLPDLCLKLAEVFNLPEDEPVLSAPPIQQNNI